MRPVDPAYARRWCGTTAGRKLSRQVVAEEPTCRIRLAGCTHISTQADHIVPVSVQPELYNVRSNLRGACAWCNNHRQTTDLADYDEPRALAYFDGC